MNIQDEHKQLHQNILSCKILPINANKYNSCTKYTVSATTITIYHCLFATSLAAIKISM